MSEPGIDGPYTNALNSINAIVRERLMY
jgi:hypothetical protein